MVALMILALILIRKELKVKKTRLSWKKYGKNLFI